MPRYGISPSSFPFILSLHPSHPSFMPLRHLIAGLGAWKLGGGCISTVLIFVLILWALGGC
jgi:hypothetical protein